MDTDGDGELSADEIYRALSKNSDEVSLERVKELVAKADTDGNGLVSKREYLDAIAADLVPQGWFRFLGRRLTQLTSRAEPEPTGIVNVDAPPGTLGLVFKRDSTELSKVLATSPLVDKVLVGWTLVSVNGEDVEMLDGWQTTRLLQAQAAAGRKLSFAVPAGAEVAEQPGVLGRVGAALAALSPRALVAQTPNAVKFTGEHWIVGEDGGHGVPYFLSENEAHIARGSYIRSRRTYSAPVSVTAELKADGKECFVLSLFNLATCTGHLHRLKNEGLSLENGAWGDKLRLLPGDHRETVGHATLWHSVQLSLDASGTARFYWNGQLKYTTSFPATSTGPLQFIGGGIGFTVRNLKVSDNTDEVAPGLPLPLEETSISIDDRRNVGFYSCSFAERKFDESAAVGAMRPTWTEKRAKHFASAMSDLVGSYEREAGPGMWHFLTSIVFVALVCILTSGYIFMMVYFWYVPFFVFGIPFYCVHRQMKHENRLVDGKIRDLCSAYSNECLALAYNAREWSEYHSGGH